MIPGNNSQCNPELTLFFLYSLASGIITQGHFHTPPFSPCSRLFKWEVMLFWSPVEFWFLSIEIGLLLQLPPIIYLLTRMHAHLPTCPLLLNRRHSMRVEYESRSCSVKTAFPHWRTIWQRREGEKGCWEEGSKSCTCSKQGNEGICQ